MSSEIRRRNCHLLIRRQFDDFIRTIHIIVPGKGADGGNSENDNTIAVCMIDTGTPGEGIICPEYLRKYLGHVKVTLFPSPRTIGATIHGDLVFSIGTVALDYIGQNAYEAGKCLIHFPPQRLSSTLHIATAKLPANVFLGTRTINKYKLTEGPIIATHGYSIKPKPNSAIKGQCRF
jgi:hypothetical protein